MNLASVEVLARAAQRGYTAAEIEPCIIKKLPQGRWIVDVDSHYYPHPKDRRPQVQVNSLSGPLGPGAAAKKILAKIGVFTTPTCSCNKRAKQMDEWGIAHCLYRHREIVGWFGEEAQKRQLTYFPAMGYALLAAAIFASWLSGTRR